MKKTEGGSLARKEEPELPARLPSRGMDVGLGQDGGGAGAGGRVVSGTVSLFE